MIKAKVVKIFFHIFQKRLSSNHKKVFKKVAKDILDVEKKVTKAKTSRKKNEVPLNKPIEETPI